MKRDEILDMLAETPVIAAVKESGGLEGALRCDAQVVFVLHGNILDIASIVQKIIDAGKAAIVHLDLIDGLASRDIAVDYIAKNTAACGVISTKPALIRRAKELDMIAVRRYFLLDSMAMDNISKQLSSEAADLIEVLPGVMPRQMSLIAQQTQMPLIAGGLINTKEDVVNALNAGAIAVSTTNSSVWNL